MVSIAGLNKASVLAALYNTARPQGMGFMQYRPVPMTVEEAQQILNDGVTYFDYLAGRVMKIDIAKDDIEPRGFDRDNGEGVVAAVIADLRTTGDINSPLIQHLHKGGTLAAAESALQQMGDSGEITHGANGVQVRLGLADVADVLRPRVERATK